LNPKLTFLATILLITVIVLSIFFTLNWFSSQTSHRQFYVGVEYAYGNQTREVKALVDKVKDYTNLFVIGSVELTFNRTALDESCDYIFNSKLNFIVLFTGIDRYNYSNGYTIMNWMVDAQHKYGDQFLGIYKIDEPGGNQLENGPSQFINDTYASYSQTAQAYVGNLSAMINYYHPYSPNIFTADFALNWFDYKGNYTAIFAEFVGNESKQRIIALDRGAAQAFHKDWGVIINWKYNQPPHYLESGDALYSDLALAYSAGAKYAFVFSYGDPNITDYGILEPEHFEALQKFWNTLHSNPGSFGSNKARAAYVVPADYGFGFRHPNDRIWGLFPSDILSTKIYNDINNILIPRYGSCFDIIYDEPQIIDPVARNYSKVFYWNQTIS
jgi:hypothetical protein